MAKTIDELANDVAREVHRARVQWGIDFDMKNTLNDWTTYIGIYTGQAAKMGASKDEVVTNLRKAAGLALLALFHAENDILAPRHYDGQPRPESLPEIDEKPVQKCPDVRSSEIEEMSWR